MPKRLVIKLIAGKEDPERLSGALNVATTALASGIDISLWLTSESSWLALPGKAEEIDLPGSAEVATLLYQIIESGSVTLCTQCAARRDIKEKDLIAGITIRGSTSFVEEIMDDNATTLVY
jgi:predicted peroxiredoxin